MITIHKPTGGVWSRVGTLVGEIFDWRPLDVEKCTKNGTFLRQSMTLSIFLGATGRNLKKSNIPRKFQSKISSSFWDRLWSLGTCDSKMGDFRLKFSRNVRGGTGGRHYCFRFFKFIPIAPGKIDKVISRLKSAIFRTFFVFPPLGGSNWKFRPR